MPKRVLIYSRGCSKIHLWQPKKGWSMSGRLGWFLELEVVSEIWITMSSFPWLLLVGFECPLFSCLLCLTEGQATFCPKLTPFYHFLLSLVLIALAACSLQSWRLKHSLPISLCCWKAYSWQILASGCCYVRGVETWIASWMAFGAGCSIDRIWEKWHRFWSSKDWFSLRMVCWDSLRSYH